MARRKDILYNDDGVYLGSLEQHTYSDSPGDIFYTCPRCSREYLEVFLHNVDGEIMCIDCWNDL